MKPLAPASFLAPVDDLAAGFAAHLCAWATAHGADAACLPILDLAAQLVSQALQDGHVCIPLQELAAALPTQRLDEIRRQLLDSHMVSHMAIHRVATDAQPQILPLHLDRADRLYLYRYYDFERRLARQLLQRAAPSAIPAGSELRQALTQAFQHNAARLGDRPDWQKLAAALALRQRLTVISGGPGTGKTTTVVALLACLLQQTAELRVTLAAPTGKAAARMLEAVRNNAERLPPELRARLPQDSSTLHRLLGVTAEAGRFRYHAQNPLPVDVLIVDEASMLDLALATRLLEAIPPQARLILLGDKDQLAAVEAGAGFAEISAAPSLSPEGTADLAKPPSPPAARIQPPTAPTSTPTPIHDNVVWFVESHRFSQTSGIGRLAADINRGQGAAAYAWLQQAQDDSVCWLENDEAELGATVRHRLLDAYRPYLDTLQQPYASQDECCRTVFAAFERFRVLCALREGPRGIAAINRLLATQLHAAGHKAFGYHGQPIMIQRNDYTLKLFNGDIGICLRNIERPNDELMAYFPAADGGYRPIALLRLPEHDTAFAMTVHKSQGSEFASVMLLLPQEASRVTTRELIYTAVTRAARQVALVGSRPVFVQACNRRSQRHSGLIDRMRETVADWHGRVE